MTAADIVLLLAAGAVTGIVGAAGGTASLISYRALLVVGIGPLTGGVMTLALLVITTGQPLPRSNALKNMLLGVADVTGCVVFVLYAPTYWTAAGPMAAGFLAGSMLGPSLIRHIPESRSRRGRTRVRYPPLVRKLATTAEVTAARRQAAASPAARTSAPTAALGGLLASMPADFAAACAPLSPSAPSRAAL